MKGEPESDAQERCNTRTEPNSTLFAATVTFHQIGNENGENQRDLEAFAQCDEET